MGGYVLAKYIRLSSEDFDNGADKAESNSVVNQRSLLDDFIQRTPDFIGCETLEFCDDGWSGTNFNRPHVKALLEQAKRGNVHCIIVKDLSRFGRNHIEVGDYLEQILPAWGVRFISVNDEFDTNNLRGITGGIDIALRNLVYDIYSKDLSAKVRSARKSIAKRGDFTSPFGFYGYVKDKTDKHRLLIDKEAAEIVRTIFNMAEDGASTTEIARTLNDRDIPTPQMRQKQNGTKRKWNMNGDRNFWSSQRIRLILTDERYTGVLISCKSERIEVGNYNTKSLPPEQWIVAPGAIPAIITQEQFRTIQGKLQYRPQREMKRHDYQTVFIRKIRCGTCRKGMMLGNRVGKNPAFFCNSKRFTNDYSCMEGTIRESVIADTLLAAIRQRAKLADGAKKLLQGKNAATMTDAEICARELSRLQTDLQKKQISQMALWENKQAGKITTDDYLARKMKMAASINLLNTQIEACEAKQQAIEAQTGRENLFVERYAGHTDIQRLTREIVDELVKVIYVYDSDRIEIIWNYADEYELLLQQLEPDFWPSLA